MWLLFGAIAIVTAILNLCAFYSQSAKWVSHEDWSALMDVVPTMSRWLWVCAIASILINSVTLFGKSSR